MTFLVVMIAALLERFFDWGHLRHWHWYVAFERIVFQRIPAKSPYLVLGMVVVSLLLVVALAQAILNGFLYGLAKFLFQLLILIYCLGPQNLWANTFACINALTKGDVHLAADKLQSTFGITDKQYSQSLHRSLLSHIFVEANRRVFAVIFWFVVLGPIGAVLYRTVSLSAISGAAWEVNSELTDRAQLAEAALDWVPVRVFSFIFALGGHFSQVMAVWTKKINADLNHNETLLVDCGTAALGIDDNSKIADDGSLERQAVSLLDRSFIIMLVLVLFIGILF